MPDEAHIPLAPAVMADAIFTTITSPAWLRAMGDDHERTWLLMRALCAELHPLGAINIPSVHGLEGALKRIDRNTTIRHQFDGRNHAALARAFGLSTRQVRRIVDKRPAK